MSRKGQPARHEAREPAPGDAASFREAVRDVRPLRAPRRAEPHRVLPRPRPVPRAPDAQALLEGLSHLVPGSEDVPYADEGSYLRPGLPREILRKLRRTHWTIERDLDLHGMSGDEATRATSLFLAACRRDGVRCVRIIHGKGLRTPEREPVLKRRIRGMLTRRAEVLAFVEPRDAEGGGGAVVALLEA
ncbi:MAG TPA: Smr/MutS family protein [Usitatibacter sp.]|nr:Smr/MutS family protein [Usitatibacter sp.]